VRTRGPLSALGLLTLAAVLLLLAAPRSGRAAPMGPVATSLSVTEEEPVAAPGDGATLYLGIETRAQDSRSAQSDAQQALERLQQGLRSAGVPAADVKVQGYRIGTARSAGTEDRYAVVQTVVAHIAKAERLGPAVEAAVASGATMVQGTSDQFQAPSATERASAVAAAVRAARADAAAIASAMQQPLGPMRTVRVQLRRQAQPGPSYVVQVEVTFTR